MKVLICALSLFVSSSFAKSSIKETVEYSEIFKTIDSYGKKYGEENVLVVFDVDDTLLVIEHCKKPNGEWTRGIGKLFSCPSEHTEEILSDELDRIQSEGFATLALTARGNNLVKPTKRELARKHEGLKTLSFVGKPFVKDLDKIEVPKTKRCKKGQTPPCLTGKVSTRPKFLDGVMYANGTHKGLALKNLLSELGEEFKAIVFVDDRKKNTDNVHMVYKKENDVEAKVFLYLRHRD